MLLKAALLACGLVGYATPTTNFDYQVQCDYLVHAISYNIKSEETWYSTKDSRSSYESLDASLSGGFRSGLVRANVAAAMSKVKKNQQLTPLSPVVRNLIMS